MKLLYIILGLSFAVQLNAQDRSSTYNYHMLPFNINSAYVGHEEQQLDFSLGIRTYQSDLKDAPRTFQGIAMMGFENNSGVGLKIVSDNRGVFQQLNTEGMYRKGIQFSENHQFSLGLNMGIAVRQIRLSRLDETVDMADPNLNADNDVRFIGGFGMLYQWNEVLDIGFSAPSLITTSENLNQHYFLNAAYKLVINEIEKISIHPNMAFIHYPTHANEVEFGVGARWDDYVWVNLSYNTNKNIFAGLGFGLKNINLGYTLGVQGGQVSDLFSVSHQLVMGLSFPSFGGKDK